MSKKKKKRLTLLLPAAENSKEGKIKQRTKGQKTKKRKHKSNMNNGVSLTPVRSQKR
jgi:hypothetical protein